MEEKSSEIGHTIGSTQIKFGLQAIDQSCRSSLNILKTQSMEMHETPLQQMKPSLKALMAIAEPEDGQEEDSFQITKTENQLLEGLKEFTTRQQLTEQKRVQKRHSERPDEKYQHRLATQRNQSELQISEINEEIIVDVDHDAEEYANPVFMTSFKSSKQSSIHTVIETDNENTVFEKKALPQSVPMHQHKTPAAGKPEILVLPTNTASEFSSKKPSIQASAFNIPSSEGLSSKITCPSHTKPFNITNYKRKPVNNEANNHNNPSVIAQNSSPDKIGQGQGLKTPCLSDSLSKDSLGPELNTILEDSLHI